MASRSDDSESEIIVPATRIYRAVLNFVASLYQTVVDLCLPVLQKPPVHLQSETFNAGCFIFIDDIVRIVRCCLLSRNFSRHMCFNRTQFYFDLRLMPKLFAYYVTIISTERMSKQLQFDPKLPTLS